MTAFLLDTHIWFWYLIGSARLPAGLRYALDHARDHCWLSPISVWELGMLAARGRIRLDTPCDNGWHGPRRSSRSRRRL
jgi:PIN domain nuclease of toxin-antitoxin system